MVRMRIRARFRHGVLEPSEPLDLEEGVEVEVELTVDEQVDATEKAEDAALIRAIQEGLTTERVTEAFIAAAGGWKGHHDDPDQLVRDLYESRITGSREPPDP